MRIILTINLLMCGGMLFAGTGHTKDMGWMYLILLASFGLILLLWNGFDHFSKNRVRYQKAITNWIQSLRIFFNKYLEITPSH